MALGLLDTPWIIYTNELGLWSREWIPASPGFPGQWRPEPEPIYCLNGPPSGLDCPTLDPMDPDERVPEDQFGLNVDMVADPVAQVLHACWLVGPRLRPPADTEFSVAGATLYYSSRPMLSAGGAWSTPVAVSGNLGYFECSIDLGPNAQGLTVPLIAASPAPEVRHG